MSYILSPVYNGVRFTDEINHVLSNGTISTYIAGSSTVFQTSYSDKDGFSAHENPIKLNAFGMLSTPIWLDSTKQYNLVVRDSTGRVIMSIDNIPSSLPKPNTCLCSMTAGEPT